jgi:hypothetical protein
LLAQPNHTDTHSHHARTQQVELLNMKDRELRNGRLAM